MGFFPELNLNTAKDADGNPIKDANGKVDQWLRHWDNDNRVAVSIHVELFQEIKANRNLSSLGIQKETRTADLGDYTAIRIVKYAPAEHTL